MSEMMISKFVLALWGGQVRGYAPRTTLFEIVHATQGKAIFGRKVGTKGFKRMSDDRIVAEFGSWGDPEPNDKMVQRAKRMYHRNWHRQKSRNGLAIGDLVFYNSGNLEIYGFVVDLDETHVYIDASGPMSPIGEAGVPYNMVTLSKKRRKR